MFSSTRRQYNVYRHLWLWCLMESLPCIQTHTHTLSLFYRLARITNKRAPDGHSKEKWWKMCVCVCFCCNCIQYIGYKIVMFRRQEDYSVRWHFVHLFARRPICQCLEKLNLMACQAYCVTLKWDLSFFFSTSPPILRPIYIVQQVGWALSSFTNSFSWFCLSFSLTSLDFHFGWVNDSVILNEKGRERETETETEGKRKSEREKKKYKNIFFCVFVP